LAVLLFVGLIVFNEVTVWRSGSQLAREVQAERLTDMNAAWERYETLQKTSFVPGVLSRPRNAIHTRLTSVADSVINEYRRSDASVVSETNWMQAQTALTKAFQIDPNDRTVRGKLYLCEGHLLRIRGTSRGQSKMLQEGRAKFEQSAELLPRSPDPYLGLARLYVYSLHDVERAEEALREADKRGYDLGRREHDQLAFGYRERGERLMRDAVKAAGLPEESELLKRAEKDLHRAEELYREIIPYGGSSVGLRRVLENLDVVSARRDAMKDSIWPWR
jgi:tetratricopeptide (TPR) repeat protein